MKAAAGWVRTCTGDDCISASVDACDGPLVPQHGTGATAHFVPLLTACCTLNVCDMCAHARRDFLRSNEDEQAIFSLVRNTTQTSPRSHHLSLTNAML